MGYFLPETESGAVQRWVAEPVGEGAERQLFITAMQECTSLPTEKPCWYHARMTCSVFLNAMNICEDFWAEKQWACQASGVSGGKPEESQSKATEQDMSAAPIASCSSFLWHVWTYRWTPQKCWNKPNSQLHCPLVYTTISGLSDWNPQMPRASPPSLLRQGSRVGDMHVKHIKAFEVFP